ALVVTAAVNAVAAFAYWALRTPAAARPQRAAAGPAASATPPAPAAPSPSPSRHRLSTGSWLLSPAGDAESFLGEDGDFAAIGSEEQVLTVVAGLADESCFTFRDEDGAYLRHFDYRLRFDDEDDSELFRKDATFCLEDGLPAGTIRLRSQNYPEHVLHRRGPQLFIDKPDGSEKFTEESTFVLGKPAGQRDGRSGTGGV
ncbi:AbfB domain-containing protein, partial [Actinoplanes sp. NPDC024001]|uniref:AbfB domain-containing protein n=1 Tax=Actinoplanes sp. NPDC024001 TaxID=3154598 RepID=UPI0033C16359